MTFSVLQLNINADNYWNNLIPYLTSNDFDILNLQEVAGNGATSGNVNSKTDCYKELQKILGERYNSDLEISQTYSSDPVSGYTGNATFYKKEFQLIEKKVITMFERTSPFPSDKDSFEDAGRNLLHLLLQKDNKTFSILNTHFAWAKTSVEEPHQAAQGEILLDYLKTVQRPFVFTGDFNLDPQQPTIKSIGAFARNLVTENNITNTLNPRTHSAFEKLKRLGIDVAVDFIFVSPDIEVKKFAVVEEDLSDHLGFTVEVAI